MYIDLSNVHYLSKLDANPIPLRVLEEKECEFRAVDGLLQIKNKEDDILLESMQDNVVYPLQQPKLPTRNRPYQSIIKEYQTVKPATKEKWHRRLGYVNNINLAKMPKMATGISFLNNDTNTEPDYWEECTLGKQHKVYGKEPGIDTKDKPGVCLNADLFIRRNRFPGVEG